LETQGYNNTKSACADCETRPIAKLKVFHSPDAQDVILSQPHLSLGYDGGGRGGGV